jgi:hypothetical protein
MIAFLTTLKHGLFICIPFSIFAVFSFWRWPRLWLHSLPADIAEMAGPKTDTERKQTKWLLIPILLILPGLSIVSTVYLGQTTQTNLSFMGALIHIYGIWIVVHLWDFLIIDCGHALFINPQRPPIPGTEGAKGYKDYGFHFRAFLRAVLMSSLFVVPSALVISLLL